jgi:hypothetical protein
MATIFKAPELITITPGNTSIFLAGTIDMGNSDNWQKQFEDRFLYRANLDIYNPRRDDWDSSWKQEFSDPQFYRQVMWEINALEKADIVIMNLLANSQSPISLLELGMLCTYPDKLRVCCEYGFWRRGNVEVFCDYFNIPLYSDLDDLINGLSI